jgi:hypothetical protein
MTGQDCSSQIGLTCDYPDPTPALHMVCSCSANADAGSVLRNHAVRQLTQHALAARAGSLRERGASHRRGLRE